MANAIPVGQPQQKKSAEAEKAEAQQNAVSAKEFEAPFADFVPHPKAKTRTVVQPTEGGALAAAKPAVREDF